MATKKEHFVGARQVGVRKIELKKQALKLFLDEFHAEYTRKVLELHYLEKTLEMLEKF